MAWAAWASPVLALDPSQALDRYVHQAWTTDQGLPQNSVYAIAQTRDGYLWLGTDEGLVRFDGLRFTVFDRTNTPAIADPFVFALHEAPDGSLWAGTDRGGLIRHRDGRFSRYGREQGLPTGARAGDHERFAGHAMGGSARRRSRPSHRRPLHVAGQGRRPGERQRARTAVDRAGTLWVGTDAGLHRLEGARFVHVGPGDGMPAGGVRAIHEDRSGKLWIGVLGGALGARFAMERSASGTVDASTSCRPVPAFPRWP